VCVRDEVSDEGGFQVALWPPPPLSPPNAPPLVLHTCCGIAAAPAPAPAHASCCCTSAPAPALLFPFFMQQPQQRWLQPAFPPHPPPPLHIQHRHPPMRALRALARPVPSLPLRSLSSAAPASSPSAVFPREGAGVNYALNWQLCDVSVVPHHAVARNAKPSKAAASVDAASAAGKLYQVSTVNKGQTVTPFGDLLVAVGGASPPPPAPSTPSRSSLTPPPPPLLLQPQRRSSCWPPPPKACQTCRSCTWRTVPSAQVLHPHPPPLPPPHTLPFNSPPPPPPLQPAAVTCPSVSSPIPPLSPPTRASSLLPLPPVANGPSSQLTCSHP
jgi:hypothetical protein